MLLLAPVVLLVLVVGGSAGSRLEVITKPISEAHLGTKALLPCHFKVEGTVALSSLRVTWYFWNETIARYEHGRNRTQHGPELPSDSELLCGDASLLLHKVTVSDEGLYTCVVGYNTHQWRGNTTLHVLAAPTISMYKQLAVGRAESALLCHVGGFYPKDVEVAWLRDGQVLNGSTRSSPQRNPDGTFSLTLTYTFTPVRSDTGAVFACRVQHPALKQPLVEDMPPDSTGMDLARAVAGAIIVGIVIVTAAGAVYCWTQSRGGITDGGVTKGICGRRR
ncbi:tapasin-related protein [Alligator mississippiensis]|uniref:tapasin-related protein n=1 Tax=Alligator mississippiensis TaxID=8496 RepID=UPI0028772E0E|nr:tapasin-related protein [Alligator mississippiensis]